MTTLAAAPALGNLVLNGPLQHDRGVKAKHVYWVVMSQPTPETVAAISVKTPADFDDDSFTKLLHQSSPGVRSAFGGGVCQGPNSCQEAPLRAITGRAFLTKVY